jgi:outer membrane receptor protein involved in Fe transport
MDVAGWQLSLRTDLSHQDDMYENQIEGLRFGERTLLDARLSAARGAWAVELWGSNLTDDRYIRSAYERFPSIFPTSPRPIDFICGDGRRFGITVRYAD